MVVFSLTLLTLSACSKKESLSAMGLLEWDRVELIAENNEPILEILTQGETLKELAVILQQDSRRVQAQLDEAEAAKMQAQSRLSELKPGPREERIDEAKAKLQ